LADAAYLASALRAEAGFLYQRVFKRVDVFEPRSGPSSLEIELQGTLSHLTALPHDRKLLSSAVQEAILEGALGAALTDEQVSRVAYGRLNPNTLARIADVRSWAASGSSNSSTSSTSSSSSGAGVSQVCESPNFRL
jgi:hypothetical protein